MSQQLIKTNCEGCIFRNGECSCEVNHPVHIEAEKQVYEGFCVDKRSLKWGQKNEFTDLQEKVETENCQLDVVYRPQCLEDAKWFVPKLHIVNKIILVIENATVEEFNEYLEIVKECGPKFTIKNLRGRIKDNIRTLDLVVSEDNLESPWVMHVLDVNGSFNELIDCWGSHRNKIYFENNLGYITNSAVYKSFGGNKENTIDKKIKGFKNGPESIWYCDSYVEPHRGTRQESEISVEAEVSS